MHPPPGASCHRCGTGFDRASNRLSASAPACWAQARSLQNNACKRSVVAATSHIYAGSLPRPYELNGFDRAKARAAHGDEDGDDDDCDEESSVVGEQYDDDDVCAQRPSWHSWRLARQYSCGALGRQHRCGALRWRGRRLPAVLSRPAPSAEKREGWARWGGVGEECRR